MKIFHTATEQKHSPYSDCTPRWPERRNPLISQRSAPCCRSPSDCLVHTRFLYIVQPSSPTTARPCVVPQIVFPYDFPLFSSSYFNDIIIHSILQCTSLGTSSSQLRDDEMLMMIIITATHSFLSHCMCALIMKILHKITTAHLVWNFLHNFFISNNNSFTGCRIPMQLLVPILLWRHAHDLITQSPPSCWWCRDPNRPAYNLSSDFLGTTPHHTLPNNHCPYNEQYKEKSCCCGLAW